MYALSSEEKAYLDGCLSGFKLVFHGHIGVLTRAPADHEDVAEVWYEGYDDGLHCG